MTVRQLDGDPAGNGHVAFHGKQAGGRLMNGHKRGGAGRLDRHGGALQIQDVGQTRCQEVLVIAGMAQQEQADFLDKVRITKQVVGQIGLHAGACENADAPVEILRHMTGILEGFPGAFKKMAMLRIKDGCLTRGKAEKSGVETFHIGEIIGGPYIVGIGQILGADPVFQHFLGAEPARAHPLVRQQIPELCDVTRRRKPPGHTNNGNLFRCLNSLNIVCHILVHPRRI